MGRMRGGNRCTENGRLRERGRPVRRRWDGVGERETEVEVGIKEKQRGKKTIAPSTLFFCFRPASLLSLARSLAVSFFSCFRGCEDEEHGLVSKRETRSRASSSEAAKRTRKRGERESGDDAELEGKSFCRACRETLDIIHIFSLSHTLEWHLERSPSFPFPRSCSSSSLLFLFPAPETGRHFLSCSPSWCAGAGRARPRGARRAWKICLRAQAKQGAF